MGLLVNSIIDESMNKFKVSSGSTKSLGIIIDMQEGFRNIYSELILDRLHRIIDEWNANFVFTKFAFASPHSDRSTNLEVESAEEETNLMSSLRDYGFKYFLHPGYLIFTKELLAYISNNKYENIYLMGVSTDLSIKYAVMQGCDLSLNIYVVKDATSSIYGKDLHEKSLESIKHIVSETHIIMCADLG